MAQMVKNLPTMRGDLCFILGWENSWRMKWQPTPAFLPGESHGQRSLAVYNSWGCRESDTAEQLTLSLSFSDLYTYLIDLCQFPIYNETFVS